MKIIWSNQIESIGSRGGTRRLSCSTVFRKRKKEINSNEFRIWRCVDLIGFTNSSFAKIEVTALYEHSLPEDKWPPVCGRPAAIGRSCWHTVSRVTRCSVRSDAAASTSVRSCIGKLRHNVGALRRAVALPHEIHASLVRNCRLFKFRWISGFSLLAAIFDPAKLSEDNPRLSSIISENSQDR